MTLDIYYDEEGDYFELNAGEPVKDYFEEIEDGIWKIIDEKKNKIKGLGILSLKARAKCITFDKESNIFYIYLKYPVKKEDVKKTITIDNRVIIDLDKKGQLLDLEILGVNKDINKKIFSDNKQTKNKKAIIDMKI